jgi:hypothetical protein
VTKLEADPLWKPFLPVDLRLNQTDEASVSVVVVTPNLTRTDELLISIATMFLEAGCYVQYTSCARHPREFLRLLKGHWQKKLEKQWSAVQGRLVLVDAYTPHFGFTDSIYNFAAKEAEKNCLQMIASNPSYAGVHTAITRAFNRIKAEESYGLQHLRFTSLPWLSLTLNPLNNTEFFFATSFRRNGNGGACSPSSSNTLLRKRTLRCCVAFPMRFLTPRKKMLLRPGS